MSYYDIDDIIADGQVCHGLGYLNGQPGEPIKENVKIELPLWLAQILATQLIDPSQSSQEEAQPILKLIEPEFFSKQFLNFIKSNSYKTNLSPYLFYYKLVCKWANMYNDTELVDLISKMLVDRASEINDLSFKLNDQFTGNNQEFLNGLDGFEKALFKTSHASFKDLKNWLRTSPNSAS
ncbi:unnamed protein product [Ambrosiozyma monospora]|uniref:Unnamed protein product n=1 Tax=Ambrosiozyma monospora TaxID=43982 RepID=A0ACB5SY61_AMBMO|nr:unnamed protein product [Ambrosiozyma monospora]